MLVLGFVGLEADDAGIRVWGLEVWRSMMLVLVVCGLDLNLKLISK